MDGSGSRLDAFPGWRTILVRRISHRFQDARGPSVLYRVNVPTYRSKFCTSSGGDDFDLGFGRQQQMEMACTDRGWSHQSWLGNIVSISDFSGVDNDCPFLAG